MCECLSFNGSVLFSGHLLAASPGEGKENTTNELKPEGTGSCDKKNTRQKVAPTCLYFGLLGLLLFNCCSTVS